MKIKSHKIASEFKGQKFIYEIFVSSVRVRERVKVPKRQDKNSK